MTSRYPQRTSSGREVKMSMRMKEHRLQEAGTLYDKTMLRIVHLSKDILQAVDSKLRPVQVTTMYRTWSTMIDELQRADLEMRQLMDGELLKKHLENFQRDFQYLDHVERSILTYVSQTKEQDYQDEVSRETSQIESEIKRLELDLTRTKRQLERSQSDKVPKREFDSQLPRFSTPRENIYEKKDATATFDFAKMSFIKEAEDPFAYKRGAHKPPPPDETGYNPGYINPDFTPRTEDVKKSDFAPSYAEYRTEPPRFEFSRSDQREADLLNQFHMDQARKESERLEREQWTHMRPFKTEQPSSAARTPAFSQNIVTGDPTLDVLNKLADILQNKKSTNRLPNMEPKTFDGDIMLFPAWISSFEALVESRYQLAGERIFYLGKYTSGEARDVIEGFLDYDTEDAYVKAKLLLISRFGDKIKIAEQYKSKLFNWPVMKPSEKKALQKFSDYLWQCHKAMSTVGYLTSLDTPEENRKILKRLPFYIADRWNRVVDLWIYQHSPDLSEMVLTQTGPFPPFVEFCRFMAGEARIANGPCSASEVNPTTTTDGSSKSSNYKKDYKKSTTLATGADATEGGASAQKKGSGGFEKRAPGPGGSKSPIACFFCQADHMLSECEKFIAAPYESKKKFCMEKGVCFGCFRRGHTYRECKIRRPELMRKPEAETANSSAGGSGDKPVTNLATSVKNTQGRYTTTILPLLVTSLATKREVLTYVAMDSQSDSCFVTPVLAEQLGISPEEVRLKLITMGEAKYISSGIVHNLSARGAYETKQIDLPKCYVREQIPARTDAIPDSDDFKAWPHLNRVTRNMMKKNDDLEIGMLLGYNCPSIMITEDYVNGKIDEPFAHRSPFGWSILGRVDSGKNEDDVSCFTTSVREITATTIKQVFDLDFQPVKSDEKLSREDTRFLSVMTDSIRQREDRHFEIDLPLKSDDARLPNNKPMAEKRLMSLKKKLLADHVYLQRYQDFVNSMVKKGQAELVDEDAVVEDGMVWYIPHLGVYHARKPQKLRVVFDASALYLSRCLNDILLSGPDQTNSLVGVLLRFRAEKIALTCDVEGMFHQVMVTARFRGLLRFLWFEDGDPRMPITEYQMEVHGFGAASSPGCANYAFKEVARRYGDTYGELTKQFLLRYFYVDDGLISVRTEEEAIDLVYSSNGLCLEGGFKLHKYSSNSRAVLKAIPEELRASDLGLKELSGEDLPIEVTLGVRWCRERDCFVFYIKLLKKPATRRGMLSSLGSIFDPLGLLSPMILQGRLILQQLCVNKFDWDEDVPADVVVEWNAWYQNLENISGFTVPRCVKLNIPEDPTLVEVHLFSDASTRGYGVAGYLRMKDDAGNLDVALIMAKARVAPARYTTIPRLELQAALLAVRIGLFLAAELVYDEITCHYWTDSQVTLGYVKNAEKRYHVYVANRVQEIVDSSDPKTWNYISTDCNPADLASRGCLADEAMKNETWWHGPAILHSSEMLKVDDVEYDVNDDDPEVKKVKVSLSTKVEEEFVLDRLSRVSEWRRLRKVVAIWRRYFRILKEKSGSRKGYSLQIKAISVVELEAATHSVVRLLQRVCFGEIYDALVHWGEYPEDKEAVRRRNSVLKKYTNIYRLDPFVSVDGVIQVGGRLKRASFSEETKHPVLLPKKHCLVDSFVRYMHSRCAHVGRDTTLSFVRHRGYWIVDGRSVLDRVLRKCVRCRRLRGGLMTQRMSDLPDFRLDPSPPFSYSGVDVFGPYEIKQGRCKRKRWICLYTDMVMRAVHLEVLPSMDTSSFINSFRRLVARRGHVRVLYCDRGSNFVGAKNELSNAEKEMKLIDLKNQLLEAECDLVEFSFNFPKASHMGGSWERMIRSVRTVLSNLLAQHGSCLDDEALVTLMVESEAIVNGRPITYASMTDPENEAPLTPSQLLTLKSKVILPPPGNFVKEDVYSRKRWRRVQYLSNLFWKQWLREFVPTLNNRHKWNEEKDCLQVDDIVLIADDGLHRSQWLTGRIQQVFPGQDNLVRKVHVRTATSSYDRPIHKLVFLYRPE